MKPKNRSRRAINGELNRKVHSLDQLAAFEQFRSEILPALQKDLKNGLTEEQILQKYKAIAAARLVTLTQSPENPTVALSASKDILDRTLGKATERKEVTHKLEKLPDKELDAVLQSQLQELQVLEAGDDEAE